MPPGTFFSASDINSSHPPKRTADKVIISFGNVILHILLQKGFRFIVILLRLNVLRQLINVTIRIQSNFYARC